MRPLAKICYGSGQISDGVKQAAFHTFLFFYYNQVLGLSGSLAGVASLVALSADAVTDPLVGQLSDRFRSRLGRRHPFMLAGALPFGLSIVALFAPPGGMGEPGLFWWMLFWAVSVRLTLTLFFVPHLSLGAEMEPDYHARTSLIGYRVFFTYASILSVTVIGFAWFFPSTDAFPNGLLNADGYFRFGLFCGALGAAAMLFSSLTTLWAIPLLHRAAPATDHRSALFALVDVVRALRQRSFRALFSATLLFNVMAGAIQALLIYVATHVYGFDAGSLAALAASTAIGVVLSSRFAQCVSRRLDKRDALAVRAAAGSATASLPLTAHPLFGLDFLS